MRGRKLWEVMFVMGRYIGRMVALFDVVVMGYLVSFVG